MNNKLFKHGVSGGVSRRGIFNRTSGVSEQGNLNKVSAMTSERVARGIPFGLLSHQRFIRKDGGGVADITGRSTFAGVVLLAFAVFILSGIFSTHTEAQADTVVPHLATLPTAVSSNTDFAHFATLGDIITLTFTFNEVLESTPSITIAGETAVVSLKAGTTATYEAVITVDSDTEEGSGTYSFAPFADLAGNIGTINLGFLSLTISPTGQLITITKVSGGDDTTERVFTATSSRTSTSFKVAANVDREDCQVATDFDASNSNVSDYTAGTNHTVPASQHSCFRIDDTDGKRFLASTADAVPPDTTNPAIVGTPTLRSNNSTTTVAKAGDTITLSFVVSEALASDPSVSIAGNTATVAKESGSTTNYTATYQVTSSTTNGQVAYDIDTLTDLASNTFDPDAVTPTGSAGVLVDRTAPVFTVSPSWDTTASQFPSGVLMIDYAEHIVPPVIGDIFNTATATDTNTVTLRYAVATSATDPTATCSNAVYTYNLATVSYADVDTAGKTRVCARAVDVAGNTTYSTATAVLTVDLTPPPDNTSPSITGTTTVVSNNTTDTNFATIGNTITITFTASETLASTPTVTIAGDTATVRNTTDNIYEAVITVDTDTDEGIVKYTIGTLTDTSSNTFDPEEITTLITVDTTDPTLTVADATNTAITSDRTFTITASDTNTVTVGYLDNVSFCSAQTSGTYTSLTLTSGTTTRVVEANEQDCFKATDTAGNITYTGTPVVPGSPPPSSTDTTAPTFDLSYAGSPNIVNNTGYYNTTTLTTGGVTVSNIVEENLATATLTLARTDTTGIPNLTPASAIHSITGAVSFANATSVPNGIYTATVTLTDDADNTTTKTLNLVVDNATPTITGITIPDPSARSSVRATVTVRHNQTIQETLTATLTGQNCSNLNRITLTGSGTTSTQIQLRGRTGTFACTITLTDQAGNTSSSFTIPSFTIERSSSGGGGTSGGGVNPGVYVQAPSFQAPALTSTPVVPTPLPTQPTTQPTTQRTSQAPLSPELQERIALLKLALNRILERIQLLLAQQAKG